MITRIKLVVLVTLHICVVIGNSIGFMFMAVYGLSDLFGFNITVPQWPMCLAGCSFIFTLVFTPGECRCTYWENQLRKELGMDTIKGFIKHYFIKPLIRIKRL